MPDEKDNEIRQRLKDIFPDEKTAGKVINLVTSKKPDGWSRKSYAPYYKEEYALPLREAVDEMIQTKNDLIYRYEIWCTHQTSMSRKTLYFRVNQSIRYLCDYLDPDGIYKKWRETTLVQVKRNLGIVISYIPEFRYNLTGLKPEILIGKR